MSDTSGQSGSSAGREVTPLLASVLAQLACPACFGDLHLDGPRLLCNGCGRVYPIVDGIPVLIVEQAEQRHVDGGKR
jgi:uncharacterized protein YbaR (Trm112 family)